MNRPIKFRTWDVPNKQMLYAFSNKFISDAFLAKEVRGDDLILMQFTGLLDKNDKEAYHKDIVRDEDGNTYLVEWDDKDAEFYLKLIHGITGFSHLTASLVKEREVIGNIYENPELLVSNESSSATA